MATHRNQALVRRNQALVRREAGGIQRASRGVSPRRRFIFAPAVLCAALLLSGGLRAEEASRPQSREASRAPAREDRTLEITP